MIQLADVALTPAALAQLARWQAEVDALPSYAARVEAGLRQFKQRNLPTNPTFAEVRRALAEMCAGPRRCCYCEDSAAVEIDHIWPKSLYPEHKPSAASATPPSGGRCSASTWNGQS